MDTPSLGWQSWSPPTPHWSRLPYRDYPPTISPPARTFPPISPTLRPTFVPDLDVRMFSLDTVTTSNLWDKMPLGIRGIGDNLDKLMPAQLTKVRQWLTT